MLLFVSYVLDKTDNMNKQFQAEGPLIHRVHSTMKGSYIDMLRLFIREDAILDKEDDIIAIDPRNESAAIRKPLRNVIVGGKCTQKLATESLGENESRFRQDALNFLVELSAQIRSRFDMSDSSALALLSCIDPAIAVDSGDERPVSLMPLAMKLPALLTGKNADTLDDQWGRLPLHKNSLKIAMHPVPITECPPGQFWKTVKNINDSGGDAMFPDVDQLMCDVLVLPHSSAAVERVFSQVNLIKTTITNKFHAATLENRLLAMQHVNKNGGCHFVGTRSHPG